MPDYGCSLNLTGWRGREGAELNFVLKLLPKKGMVA